MAITTDSVLNALKAGTFTLTTLTSSRMFKIKQPEKRRKYPSLELLETPLGNTATQERLDFIRKFDIRLFLGLRGGTTTGQEDEISSLEILESEILVVMESTVLGEHKIVVEEKKWNRTYNNEGLRPYIMSILTITIRQITAVADIPDGVLIYDESASTADNKPASDYTYDRVYNVDIGEGVSDVDESINKTVNPQRFAGDFGGTFIAHLKVKDVDLGSTSEKLDQITKVQANGEKQIITFIHTDKLSNTPTTKSIQTSVKLTLDQAQRIYRVGDVTVIRLLGKLLEPTATTVI